MLTASNSYGKIYCDFTTRRMAANAIEFDFVDLLEYSHKQTNESIYEPNFSMHDFSSHTEERRQLIHDKKTPSSLLKDLCEVFEGAILDRFKHAIDNRKFECRAPGKQTIKNGTTDSHCLSSCAGGGVLESNCKKRQRFS